MKIDLTSIDRQNFMVHEHIVNGEVLTLVQPIHFGAVWTQANKIFRSSVWNGVGELVSAGFPKFTNWGENPLQFPLPDSLSDAVIPEKLDGSLFIVSKYKGKFIMRTRGTVDASNLDNAHELKDFKRDYLPLVDSKDFAHWTVRDTWPFSILFEWVSPTNKIVLNYGEIPLWYLVGMVNHEDYSLVTQNELDELANKTGLIRPTTYNFKDISALIESVDKWEGKEGVCVYSNGGQTIHKVKSAWYLVRHHMKSELNSMDKVLEFWIQNGRPDFAKMKELVLQFDHELWDVGVMGFTSKICDAYKEVNKIIEGMQRFVDAELVKYPTRGLQAVVVFQSYGKNTNRSQYVFKILDRKPLNDQDILKLMYQVLKK